MARAAHHRTDFRQGPWASWVKRKTYHLTRLFRAVSLLGQILADLEPTSVPGVYRLSRHLHILPAAREAFADASLYLADETGDVWR